MTTILRMVSAPLCLHPGRCYVCFENTDAPIITTYHPDYNEKVKICSDKCLNKYQILENSYKERYSQHLLNQKTLVLKPTPLHKTGTVSKMEKARAHLQALKVPVFNDDMKLEDIEELDLNAKKEEKKS